MAYASASDVAANSQSLLHGADSFGTSSSPMLSEVRGWLSSGCSIIETRVASHGYTVPVTAGTRGYDWAKDLNAIYATARAELSRTNVTLAPGERTRGQVFLEMFWDGLEEFLKMDLTLVGIARGSSGTLYAGGISKSDKQLDEADSDRVQPRFKRGQFEFPGTIRPSISTD